MKQHFVEFHVTSSLGADLITYHPSVAAEVFMTHVVAAGFDPNGATVEDLTEMLEFTKRLPGLGICSKSVGRGDRFVSLKVLVDREIAA